MNEQRQIKTILKQVEKHRDHLRELLHGIRVAEELLERDKKELWKTESELASLVDGLDIEPTAK